VVSFGCVHDSARSPSIGWVLGTTAEPALTFTSRLMQYESGIIVLNGMVCVRIEVNRQDGLAEAEHAPRFGGCASAVVGFSSSTAGPTVLAATAAPPNLSMSRRVISMVILLMCPVATCRSTPASIRMALDSSAFCRAVNEKTAVSTASEGKPRYNGSVIRRAPFVPIVVLLLAGSILAAPRACSFRPAARSSTGM
jgi:hypothetical protein